MGLKDLVQKSLHEKNLKKYEQEVARQKDAYGAYISVFENDAIKKLIPLRDAANYFDRVRIVQFNELLTDPSVLDGSCPYILFLNGDGLVPERAGRLIEEKFDNDPNLNIIYFDEDEIEKESGKRLNPWFKADWSPNSILNSFYFGNVVAIRKSIVTDDIYAGSENCLENLYKIILKNCFKSEPMHFSAVFFHKYTASDMECCNYNGGEAIFDKIKEEAYKDMGVNATFYLDSNDVSHALINVNKNKKVSIIIPSKDNPDVLQRCVSSIRDKSTHENYEIIVIDNGSSSDNKAKYENLSKKFDFKYVYEEMPFNFSKMCNRGAYEADGVYFLFLNDDTEVITSNWIELMEGQASLPQVGAVGAKLYYPKEDNTENKEIDKIQHIGITNMTEGPSHKLQGHEDAGMIYHGVNVFDRDVIGVTAACLMVSRDKYDMTGGFNKDLKVAYNDVFFCFQLYILGFYNVVRNDVKLVHYESLSRGNDHADEEKLNRLKEERRYLYSHFPQLYGIDPFYSAWLTGASEEYECVLPFENRNIRPVGDVDVVKFPNVPVNETLIINVDLAEKELLWRNTQCAIIDLHSHVRGLDNSDYTFRLLLKKDDVTLNVPVIRRIRPDVIKTFPDEIHVELSGFIARIPVDYLQEGEYEIWMEAKSVISRQVLVNKAEATLVI